MRIPSKRQSATGRYRSIVGPDGFLTLSQDAPSLCSLELGLIIEEITHSRLRLKSDSDRDCFESVPTGLA
ncbi:hypothetical protein [Novipirellula maiorica]|nr:hypothetical protein [Rhodopirellula maiorica]